MKTFWFLGLVPTSGAVECSEHWASDQPLCGTCQPAELSCCECSAGTRQPCIRVNVKGSPGKNKNIYFSILSKLTFCSKIDVL
ncbi:unnamed protein product [Nesidiocoris tenuis]|uniref:Uncharacterized protein n=1 Tax=Nesidiocoris tenuis TaxID=355587 RepID=A0A6H5G7K7_9HEMI|nr:unnamed protein product [Nesidiocoris tenuis]